MVTRRDAVKPSHIWSFHKLAHKLTPFFCIPSINQRSILHVAKHRIEPEEIEEAIFEGNSIVLKSRAKRYIVLSQSSGRYLMVVVAFKMKGRIRVITARDMNRKEGAYYNSLIK
jgi:uncharacterized DUF497 family protein